ncbi:MAG: hypothetical protein Q7S95_02455 [bacterium]|nr:hypothetical protein [bacterium]
MARPVRSAIPDALARAFGRIAQARKRRGLERGRRNEQRVYSAFEYPAVRYGFPPWFRYLRACTREEDADGIDAVIETDGVGKILVQIKSSELFARKFRARRGRRHIIVVVIRDEMSPEDVRETILAEATAKYQALMAMRTDDEGETPAAVP